MNWDFFWIGFMFGVPIGAATVVVTMLIVEGRRGAGKDS